MITPHQESVMNRSMSWVALLVFASGTVAGQEAKGVRATAEQKVNGRAFAFEYGVISAADRTLADLGVGQFWNPGASPAVLAIEAPLRAKDALVAPGRYAVKFGRRTETEWVMLVQGVPRSFTASRIYSDLDLPVVRKEGPATERLVAKWSMAKAPDKDGSTGITLELRVGTIVLELSGSTFTGPERSSQGWTGHGWAIPADLHASMSAAGVPTPFVTFRHADAADPKRERVFNLMVLGDWVGVIPASEGPGPDGTPIALPAPELFSAGNWQPAKAKSPQIGTPLIEIKGRIGMYLRVNDGARHTTFTITEPDFGQKKKSK
jgi:hypothetical protein